MSFQLYRILEIIILLVLFIHWSACLEYYLPLVIAQMVERNNELVFEEIYISYNICLYT